MRSRTKTYRVEDLELICFLHADAVPAGLWLAARIFPGWKAFDVAAAPEAEAGARR